MPPMPPIGRRRHRRRRRSSRLGASAIIASVVMSRPATEAASWRAVRTDLGGVDDAGLQHVDVFLGLGVEAVGLGRVVPWIRPTTIEPSTPEFSAILTDRRLERAQDDL